MLNWPLATAALVVQVTGRLAPWALLVVPVGAVTVIALNGVAAFGLIGTAVIAAAALLNVQLMVTELPVACSVLAPAIMLVAGLEA